MEERTFISGISDLIDNVGKCKCYDDARNLLNSFVIENVGKKYETEDGTAYRNSNNPKDIKRETLATIDNTLYRWELIDEASEDTLNEAIKYHNIRGGGTIKSNFVDLRVKIKVTKQFVEAWRKEAAPIIKKKETVRLRPKKGNERFVDVVFEFLAKDEKYLSYNDREAWHYLCGISDVVPNKPIKWKGDFFSLGTLFDLFLVQRTNIFEKKGKGSINEFVASQFGYNYNKGFKQQLSRDYTKKMEMEKREVYSNMINPQVFTK
jgi:hypothetical protein